MGIKKNKKRKKNPSRIYLENAEKAAICTSFYYYSFFSLFASNYLCFVILPCIGLSLLPHSGGRKKLKK